MAITLADFNKIWSSTSPLSPYTFSDDNYNEGWNFIGQIPPSRQMWDFLQKNNDEKMQYLANNYLPLSGGTMTGDIQYNGDNSNVFKLEKAGKNINFGWNYSSYDGALLALRSSSNTNAGQFVLQARANNTEKTFAGNPDGTLTWDNDPIPVIGDNAGGHNSVYRGKNLGNTVTDAQYDQINAGTFRDLYIGDYWVINGVNWRIAAFDYWYNTGDTECTTHHVIIVPDSNLATCQMNNSNVTTGAYIGSDYYTGNNSNTGKATVQTAINNAFGSSHILTHREYLKNAVANGYESAVAWYDSEFELMTEQMVYGCKVFGNVVNGTNVPASYTIDKSQLPLFALEPSRITNRAAWWLRDVVSAAYFAQVYSPGYCSYSGASNSNGVRPAFAIKK